MRIGNSEAREGGLEAGATEISALKAAEVEIGEVRTAGEVVRNRLGGLPLGFGSRMRASIGNTASQTSENPDDARVITDIDQPLPSRVALIAGGHAAELISRDGTLYAWTEEGGRDKNEDGFLIDEETGQYAVADGMGGGGSGERASFIALRTVAFNRDKTVPLDALTRGATRVLRKKIEDSKSTPIPISTGAGTTLVTARILEKFPEGGGRVEFGELGDSKWIALDISARRKLGESVGQSLVEKDARELPIMVEDYFDKFLSDRVLGPVTQEIKREAYMLCHPDARIVTNSICGLSVKGNQPPIVETLDCPSGSVILLLCDGVTSVVSTYEIEQIFYENPFEEACQILQRTVEQRQNELRMRKDLLIGGMEPTMVLREWPDGQKTILKIGRVYGEEGRAIKVTYPTDNTTFVAKRLAKTLRALSQPIQ